MARITNPLPLFLDTRGALLDAGSVYIGVAGSDPEIEANQIAVYFDKALSIPADQPLRTQGGMIVNGADPSFVYTDAADWAITTRTADGELVSYLPSVAESTIAYQPLDSDLTAIAELATTSFGRSLLTIANAGALRDAADIPEALALTGGTISGNITRSGGGSHLYHADSALASGRVFVTASGAADPTSQAGDIWIELAA